MEYKYVVLDATGAEACAEKGFRKLSLDGADPATTTIVKDEAFNYHNPTYKSAGVSIPVSGIKTRESTGIGEFMDLKPVAD
ncbi:hypothetical protein T484DRAFT_1809721, partial [Baffinella frigidus]